MPYILAELTTMLLYTLICLITILTVFRSSLKLLLVVNFDLIFNLDSKKLAMNIFILSAIAAILPNLSFTAWILSTQRCCSSVTVAFLVGSQENQFPLNYASAYTLMWVVVSLILSIVVKLGVPAYLQRVHNSQAIRYIRKTLSRYLDNNIKLS
jgi:hypothetical protein